MSHLDLDLAERASVAVTFEAVSSLVSFYLERDDVGFSPPLELGRDIRRQLGDYPLEGDPVQGIAALGRRHCRRLGTRAAQLKPSGWPACHSQPLHQASPRAASARRSSRSWAARPRRAV